ncbi:Nop14-like protein [Piromyces finnis]|uniref:Nop14-like protein n=1 Tax=Piromyces finnis TaxID=1754191 RepID=A0A1Y1V8G3_9FUNG|nr:Nop14-like protein [Piromyces finnis]|eukprot:ORX48425.1 Nop14-like protein [Piromyces finnis]
MVNQKKSNVSALKRLKTRLKSSGIIGENVSSKKKGFDKKELRKKTKEKLENLKKETNPFEIKFTKQKHDIMGRKIKGIQGKPGQARSKAEKTRKNTLLVEYEKRNKNSSFVDRRFGENDPTLSLEDKMMERFIREKQRKSNHGDFNLEDEQLTHFGQALGDHLGDDIVHSDDESDNGQIDQFTVHQDHFGGFDEEEEKSGEKKSKSEIMKELIAKSKYYKYERQKEKEENEEIKNEVDAELEDIKKLVNQSLTEKNEEEKEKLKIKRSKTDDQYNSFLKAVASDRRARPTDRLKSEEELAIEAKEKLERAERDRQRRMNGIDSDEEEENDSKNRPAQADDLDDGLDYNYDEEESMPLTYKDGKLINQDIGFSRKRKAKDDDDEEISDDDDENDDDDDDAEDEEDEGEEETDNDDILNEDDDKNENEDDNESGDDELEVIKKTNKQSLEQDENVKKEIEKRRKERHEQAKNELGYVFSIPESHSKFLELIKDKSIQDQMTIIKRIRILYNVKIHPQNKDKLTYFFGIILQHLNYLTNKSEVSFDEINRYTRCILSFAFQFIEYFNDYAKNKLIQIEKKITKKLSVNGKEIINLNDLIFLQLITVIYSTSDYSHPIITPALLIMENYLSQAIINNERDIVRGLYLCNIMYMTQKQSKRYIPEAMNFIMKTLLIIVPESYISKNTKADMLNSNILVNNTKYSLTGKDWENVELKALNLSLIMSNNTSKKEYIKYCKSNELRISIIGLCIELLEKYSRLYMDIGCLKEIFSGVEKLVSDLEKMPVSDKLKESINKFKSNINSYIAGEGIKRRSLQWQKRKPVAIASIVPKFEENYSVDKHYDKNRERAEYNKLKAQVQKEKKGALRELRKDNMFLARKRLQEIREKDREYKEKIKGIYGMLGNEQGEQNKYDRERKKRKN